MSAIAALPPKFWQQLKVCHHSHAMTGTVRLHVSVVEVFVAGADYIGTTGNSRSDNRIVVRIVRNDDT